MAKTNGLNKARKFLVTGATGFVGGALVTELLRCEINLVATVRQRKSGLPENIKQEVVEDFSEYTDWARVLSDIDVVIHTAARVHIMDDRQIDPILEYRKVNVEGTLNIAKKAVQAGVKRFVFISSIKVNGEMTNEIQSFKPDDSFIPDDPYGLSKYEAEKGLLSLAEETELEVVIIRPPLVYGPGVKANFSSMMNWINKGIPLPFGAIHNQRSLVALDNLVSFIVLCSDREKSPQAINQVFLISDGEDVSTSELLRKVAKALGKKSMLLPIPVSLMKYMAKMIGKEDVASRLFGSLQVDSSKARNLLGWKPVITMDEQLKKMGL